MEEMSDERRQYLKSKTLCWTSDRVIFDKSATQEEMVEVMTDFVKRKRSLEKQ